MLMMEGIENAAINPTLTPNIWSIKEMSTSVDGYYGIEKTTQTEQLALTGANTLGQEVYLSYSNVTMPQALPSIFAREGYDSVSAFHDYKKDFYNRNVMFSPDVMGFKNFYNEEDYGQTPQDQLPTNSDLLMFSSLVDKMAPSDESFFSYILNVATHGSHFDLGASVIDYKLDDTGNRIQDKWGHWLFTSDLYPEALSDIYANYDEFAKLYPKLTIGNDDERMALFRYCIETNEYDRGIGVLLNYLEKTPDLKHDLTGKTMLINTTALVFYTDHYVYTDYQHPANPGGSVFGDNNNTSPVGEKLPFIIYNPRDTDARTNPKTITRFTSNMDIYPTVCDLFGINTSRKFTFGYSVFDPQSMDSSLGMTILTSTFFGFSYEPGKAYNTGTPYSTKDFDTFSGDRPTDNAITHAEQQAAVMLQTAASIKSFYSTNTMKDQEDAYYYFGSALIKEGA